MWSEDQLVKHSRKNSDVGLYDERHGYAKLRIHEGARTDSTELQ